MITRLIMASRRFPKDYVEFLAKYSELEQNLRDFLDFRQTHLPNESYGSIDGRLSMADKLRRCHLMHGKAILIYQLHGSEIRLITVSDHNVLENNAKTIINYHRSLQTDDFYTFNIDDPMPAKPVTSFRPTLVPEPPVQEPVPEPEVQEPESVQEPEVPQSPPTNGAINPLWEDKVIRLLEGRQLVYEPRPSRKLVAFVLDREIIAPRGDVLAFDAMASKVYHLSQAEFDAGYRLHARNTTDLGEAFVIAVQADPERPVAVETPAVAPVLPTATPEPEPEPEPEPKVPEPQLMPIRRPPRRNNISAQTGRLLAALGYLQRTTGTNKIASAKIKELLEGGDVTGASTTLIHAQEQNLVRKLGAIPGSRGYYYCLTANGEKQVKLLGDWPFTVVGRNLPFEMQNIAASA